MRKLLSVLLMTILCATATQAQNYYMNEDCYWGVRLGVNVGNLAFDGLEPDKSSHTGLNFGVVYGMPVSDDMPIYFEPGLLITAKGVKVESSHKQEIKSRLTYLEIPVVFKYRFEEVSDDVCIEPFFGGFFAMGIGGKTKDFENRVKRNSFGSGAYEHFDAGIRLGCGLAYRNLYAEMSYDWGLANIAQSNFNYLGYDSFDDTIRTRCLTLSVGLNF